MTAILKATEQELFDPAELPIGLELLQPEEQQRKRFTAERVAMNRERYMQIVAALAENLPMRSICRAFGVSHHVVKAIRERDPELVATEKQRISRLLGHVARYATETYAEALSEGKVGAHMLPVHVGILLDKKAMLDGDNIVRIEHVTKSELTVEAFLDQLKKIPGTAPSDFQSGARPALSEGNPAKGTMGASQGTIEPVPEPVKPEESASCAAPGNFAKGGGGVRKGGGGRRARWIRPNGILAQRQVNERTLSMGRSGLG